jgi:oligopeptide/dipeptide ABC transporter ATP-binding protein
MDKNDILKIQDLSVSYKKDGESIAAVNKVSLNIKEKEVLALIGESGCGKTTLALSILKLLPRKNISWLEGKILFENRNLLELNDTELRDIRGSKISMIFQEPKSALNPVFTIGEQLSEVLKERDYSNRNRLTEHVIEVLKEVGIPSPEERFSYYPYQLSGGQAQRVMIAMAILGNPGLLIADEPTTALDVTIQAQILELLKELRKKKGLSVLLITHDIGILEDMADSVAVMFKGRVIEYCDIGTFFKNPLHPYTIELMNNVPKAGFNKVRLGIAQEKEKDKIRLLSRCVYLNRCNKSNAICMREESSFIEVEKNHFVNCLMAG